jgi:hypothetical protein
VPRRRAPARVRYRAFAVACIETQVERALLRAGDGEPEDHLSLPDAFTMMIFAGLPRGFRIAFVTETPVIDRAFHKLRRHLHALALVADVFGDEHEACDGCAPGM